MDAGPQGLQDVRLFGMLREDDGPGTRRDLHDLPGGIQPIQMRHRQIQDRHLGAGRLGLAERVAPVHGLRDDREPFTRQQEFQSLADDGVVVRNHHPDRHRIHPAQATLVPSPAFPSTARRIPGGREADGEGLMADPPVARGEVCL